MKNKTKSIARKFDPRKTYRRDLPIDSSRIRNVSITVRPASISPAPGVWIDAFEVVQDHECFTGFEWLPILNKDERYTFEDAVALAKELVDSFMEDSFLQAEVDSQCC